MHPKLRRANTDIHYSRKPRRPRGEHQVAAQTRQSIRHAREHYLRYLLPLFPRLSVHSPSFSTGGFLLFTSAFCNLCLNRNLDQPAIVIEIKHHRNLRLKPGRHTVPPPIQVQHRQTERLIIRIRWQDRHIAFAFRGARLSIIAPDLQKPRNCANQDIRATIQRSMRASPSRDTVRI